MTKKITVQYWAKTGSGENRVRHVFDVEVRRDMWDGLSDIGRVRFLQEELWDDMQCGYRVVESKLND